MAWTPIVEVDLAGQTIVTDSVGRRTSRELLERILTELRISNLYFSMITEQELKPSDLDEV